MGGHPTPRQREVAVWPLALRVVGLLRWARPIEFLLHRGSSGLADRSGRSPDVDVLAIRVPGGLLRLDLGTPDGGQGAVFLGAPRRTSRLRRRAGRPPDVSELRGGKGSLVSRCFLDLVRIGGLDLVHRETLRVRTPPIASVELTIRPGRHVMHLPVSSAANTSFTLFASLPDPSLSRPAEELGPRSPLFLSEPAAPPGP